MLALAGDNVRVEQDPTRYREGTRRGEVARTVSEGGVLTRDVDLVRTAARHILQEVLCCHVGMSNSGRSARVAGVSIRADGWLPSMAHDDFLTKLSKGGITDAVRSLNILPRNTGKEMRAALKEQVGQGRWVHPATLFALTVDEQASLARDPSSPEPSQDSASDGTVDRDDEAPDPRWHNDTGVAPREDEDAAA